MAERQKSFSLLPKVLNGAIAGYIGVCCVFPLDLVKTRLQNQTIGPNGELMYTSILDAFRKTFKKEGFFGMYKGSGINLLLIMPEKAIKLAANDYFRYHLSQNGKIPIYRQILAGAGAACCQMVITVPMELIKIQLQDAGRTAAAKVSTLELMWNILKTEGPFGFYRGLKATMIRDVPFSMIYFPLFAAINDSCPRRADDDAVLWCTFGAGLLAGSVGGLAVTPSDVVKTRFQTVKKGKGEETYSGLSDAFIKIHKREGWKALFKGGACRVMVIAPMFGIAQAVYYIGIAEWLLGIDKHV